MSEALNLQILDEIYFLNQGKNFEMNGNFKSAFDIYIAGMKKFPSEKEFPRRMAIMLLNNGKNKSAEAMFENYFKNNKTPRSDTIYIYGGYLEEAYGVKKAVNFYKRVNILLNSNEIEKLIKRLEKTNKKLSEKIIDEGEKRDIEINPNDIMDIFGYFSGREDNYAIQWRDDETGKYGYAPANSPLTFNKVKSHLYGETTLGIYQLNTQNQVKWVLFDIDINKEIVEQKTDEGKDFKFYLYQAYSIAEKIKEQASLIGLKGFIENSGYKGYHVWFFFEEFVSAKKAKTIMDFIVGNVDFEDFKKIISIEIFPKQTDLKGKKLGNLVKLPFGIHKKSGKRSFFVDDFAKPLKSVKEFFKQVSKTNIKDFSNIYSSIERGKDSAKIIKEEQKKGNDTDILGDPELEILISKCKMLDFIVNKVIWEKKCSDEEFNIIRHTLGHLKNGKKIVNGILDILNNTDEELRLKKSLTGYPMGCKKLKQNVPEIAARFDCNCEFKTGLKTYNHPLLHLDDDDLVEEEIRKDRQEAIKFQNYLDMFLETRRELKNNAEKLKLIEKKIYEYLNVKGLDRIKTKVGILRKVSHPDGGTQLLMEL